MRIVLVNRKRYEAPFPSPCGDVVLKFIKEAMMAAAQTSVSVPLRGCGFEMIKEALEATAINCFRPLAGMWF